MTPTEGVTGRFIHRAVAAAALLLLGGCALGRPSGSPTALTPLAAVKAAASKVSSDSAQTVHFNGSSSVGSLGSVQVDGVEQFAPSLAAEMKIDTSGGQLGAGSGGSIELILKDGIEYVNLGALGSQLTGAEKWLKIDLSALANQTGNTALSSTLSKLSQGTDPSEQMKLLITSGDLKMVGNETVDGVRSTHYVGTVDVARAVQQNAGANLSHDEIQKLKDSLQQAGITTEHIDIWLDSANLPVEVRTSATLTALGEIRADIHFSDWGRPVTITPPPADQVVDISQLGPGRTPPGG